MKKIILNKAKNNIFLEDIDTGAAIFVKKDHTLIGMIIDCEKGWTIATGDSCIGFFNTRYETIEFGIEKGYEFFIS